MWRRTGSWNCKMDSFALGNDFVRQFPTSNRNCPASLSTCVAFLWDWRMSRSRTAGRNGRQRSFWASGFVRSPVITGMRKIRRDETNVVTVVDLLIEVHSLELALDHRYLIDLLYRECPRGSTLLERASPIPAAGSDPRTGTMLLSRAGSLLASPTQIEICAGDSHHADQLNTDGRKHLK